MKNIKKISLLGWVTFILLIILSITGAFMDPGKLLSAQGLVPADIAWVMIAGTLVFLMTPGLSFFYGGMVNNKNIISTMLQSFIATGLISIFWVVIGFSLAFGPSSNGLIGDPTTYFFFRNIQSGQPYPLAPTIPLLLYALFQLKFAIIAPAIVVGAVAERIQFKAYLLFMFLFSLLIYVPIAHWTWNPDGILAQLGVLDFAGGTVVHITAGCAALAGAIVLKQRKRFKRIENEPSNIPFVLLGTGLLWFGWFGFNAGSAMGANGLAISAFATTNTATAASGLSWIFFDSIRGRKPSAMGFCIGAVVGMVAITPASGYVGIPQSLCIGVVASLISNIAVHWRNHSSLDDTLDVFPCHGIGGMVGMLLTGVFASSAINPDIPNGWMYGNFSLFATQFLGLVIVAAYSFGMAWAIFKLVNLIYPIRVSEDEEELGLDISQHDESNSIQDSYPILNF